MKPKTPYGAWKTVYQLCAALLLLSCAGIVIYALLALTSHLLLRRWHESALGKDT